MMRALRLLSAGLVVACLAQHTFADISAPVSDGWYSWIVDAPEAAAALCCWSEPNGHRGCNLDGRDVHYTMDGNCMLDSGELRIFVLQKNNRPSEIRLLGNNCRVSSNAEIAGIGRVSVEETVRWLSGVIEDPSLTRGVREEALFALTQSGADIAYEYLDTLLSKR